jgi:hypothetical protein
MANPKNNTMATSSAMPRVNTRPLHVAHTALIEASQDDVNALFAQNVAHVSHGARVLAEIMRSQINSMDSVSQGSAAQPLLSVSDADALVGLLAASLGMIYDLADLRVESLNEQASKGQRA